MSEPNLPPFGSVWLGAACEVRRVLTAVQYSGEWWIRFDQTGCGRSAMVPLAYWLEWQSSATQLCPTAPQPDLAAEVERLKAALRAIVDLVPSEASGVYGVGFAQGVIRAAAIAKHSLDVTPPQGEPK